MTADLSGAAEDHATKHDPVDGIHTHEHSTKCSRFLMGVGTCKSTCGVYSKIKRDKRRVCTIGATSIHKCYAATTTSQRTMQPATAARHTAAAEAR